MNPKDIDPKDIWESPISTDQVIHVMGTYVWLDGYYASHSVIGAEKVIVMKHSSMSCTRCETSRSRGVLRKCPKDGSEEDTNITATTRRGHCCVGTIFWICCTHILHLDIHLREDHHPGAFRHAIIAAKVL